MSARKVDTLSPCVKRKIIENHKTWGMQFKTKKMKSRFAKPKYKKNNTKIKNTEEGDKIRKRNEK